MSPPLEQSVAPGLIANKAIMMIRYSCKLSKLRRQTGPEWIHTLLGTRS